MTRLPLTVLTQAGYVFRMSKPKGVVITASVLLIVACGFAVAQNNAFSYEEQHPRIELGAGMLLLFPYAHVELRYYPTPTLSLDGFLSAGKVTVSLFGYSSAAFIANAGAEARAHLYVGRIWDFHLGAGLSALASIAGDVQLRPLLYGDAGVTLAIGNRLRIEAEIDPFVTVPSGNSSPFGIIPIVQARLVV